MPAPDKLKEITGDLGSAAAKLAKVTGDPLVADLGTKVEADEAQGSKRNATWTHPAAKGGEPAPAPEPEPEPEAPAEPEPEKPAEVTDTTPYVTLEIDGRKVEIPDAERAQELIREGLLSRERPKRTPEQDQAEAVGREWMTFSEREKEKAEAIMAYVQNKGTLETEPEVQVDISDATDLEKQTLQRLAKQERLNAQLQNEIRGIRTGAQAQEITSTLQAEVDSIPFLKGGTRGQEALQIATSIMQADPRIPAATAVLEASARIRALVGETQQAAVERQERRSDAKLESPSSGSPAVKSPEKPLTRKDLHTGASLTRIFKKAAALASATGKEL